MTAKLKFSDKQFGMDIETVKSTQNKYHLVSREFDVAELKLLIDAVESSKFISAKKSEQLVAKISKFAGSHKGSELKRNIFPEGRIKPVNEQILLIVDAVNEATPAWASTSFLSLVMIPNVNSCSGLGKSGCLSVRSLLTTCPRLTPSEPKSNVQRGGFAPLCTFGIQTKNQYPFIIYKPNRRVCRGVKKAFQEAHIYITSDNDDDVRTAHRQFFRWKKC